MSSKNLLRKLNRVLHTRHQLYTSGMRSLLSDLRRSAHDFGAVYGAVRQWWRDIGSGVEGRARLQQQCEREVQHETMRQDAIKGSSLTSSKMPPRRIWDLYSNRVLPFAVIPLRFPRPTLPWLLNEEKDLPGGLCTVSHSWVEEENRENVWTPINGSMWPVPTPRSTSLEHVRIELLNMGAEYVWLDILCLRQQGHKKDEAQRRAEWMVDVPTIGFIYTGKIGLASPRPCVIYFNGLGLPLDVSPGSVASDRHWFNRVWTMQETVHSWLPGGLTGGPVAGAGEVFSRLETLFKPQRLDIMARDIMGRKYTKELDAIAGLAYCLGCNSLPLYDETMPLEHSWQLLLKHISPISRAHISLRYPAAHTPFPILPSWDAFTATAPLGPDELHVVHLAPVDSSQLHSTEPGQYHHIARVLGPCRFSAPHSHPARGDSAPELLVSALADGVQTLGLKPLDMHGIVLRDVPYMLVYFPGEAYDWTVFMCWGVVEVMDEQSSQLPDESEIKMTAARSAVLLLTKEESAKLRGLQTGDEWERRRRLKYITGEEAVRRSRHGERYTAALEEMRASRKSFMILP
ncbi:hypothetical protein PsYK624_002220 [Phanerochaete sordida]|uniref:Heterokaryon incompatibility domain-containing protein n=1 Tax=Phanerochaete sordida TaxID=48140 RepID=A0A9P3L6K9_9APHY|nr:hypothetical protein PsYK624_002220 [Phanerochaete sordida]